MEKVQAGYQADRVKDGRFQAMMEVALVNDGPVIHPEDKHWPMLTMLGHTGTQCWRQGRPTKNERLKNGATARYIHLTIERAVCIIRSRNGLFV